VPALGDGVGDSDSLEQAPDKAAAAKSPEKTKILARMGCIWRSASLMAGPPEILEALCAHCDDFVQLLPRRAGALHARDAMRLNGLTVLVVEDDVDNLELLSSHVESEGALALSAGSIGAALLMTAERRVDVALCDLELADGDGCELVRQLRGRAGWEKLPAIAITGYSGDPWRKKANDCGFNRFAVKPYSLEQITLWVAELSSAPS